MEQLQMEQLQMEQLHSPRAGGGGVAAGPTAPQRVEIDPETVREGLGRLVLSLVNLVHELLERQAVRRMEAGSLSDAEVERVGRTLMLQAAEIERLREVFGLKEEDLNLDLGPLGRLV